MKKTTEEITLYGVARGETILDETLYEEQVAADQYHRIEEAMRTAGLEPDVRLVEVTATVTTTYSRPRAAKLEDIEAATTTETTGSDVTFPTSGIWGDTPPVITDPQPEPAPTPEQHTADTDAEPTAEPA